MKSKMALYTISVALAFLVGWGVQIGWTGTGTLYSRAGVESPKVLQDDDTVGTWWDKILGGKKVVVINLMRCEDETHNVCRTESQWNYETIAASQTDQAMGATGAIGDLLSSVVCEMSAASVGVVTIKDGSGSAINVIEAQAAAGHPSTPPLNIVSTSGAWKISTGTNTTCIGIGRFT